MKKNLFLSFHSAAVALNYALFRQDHIHRDIVRLPVRKLLLYAVLRSKRYLEKAFLPVFSEVFIRLQDSSKRTPGTAISSAPPGR